MLQGPIPFGKYKLLDRISVGGMAEVYKASRAGEQGFQKILAIKKILPSLTDDAEFVRMFIDEAKIAGQLNHANICQIYELGKLDGAFFIAMEYVWGKDLLKIRQRHEAAGQAVPLGQACFILSKLCEALDYAHKKRDPHGHNLHIVHRDVSPQNILVSYEGEVKLIDFGIAKARNRSAKTAAGVLKGKFGYMSPEQVRGMPIDHRSDIFSLGIILYEMLTGQPLFDGETDFVVLEKVRRADVVPPSQLNPLVPPELDAIVMKALKANPADRYQWAAEMQKAVQAFMMTQRPIYSARRMAEWMQKTFGREIIKERRTMERFFGALKPRRAKTQPPAPPPAALGISDDLDDAEGETVIDDTSPFGPLEPIYDEPAAEPVQAPVSGDVDDEDIETHLLEDNQGALPILQEQPTVMLDDDDPEASAMAQKVQAIARQSSVEDAGVDIAAPQQEAPPAVYGASVGRSVTPTVGVDAALVPSAETVTRRAKGVGAGFVVILLLATAVGAFAGGAFLMRWKQSKTASAKTVVVPQLGSLVLAAKWSGTEVIVDNTVKRTASDGFVVIEGLRDGKHRVSVSAPGYLSVKLGVQIRRGRVTVMSPKLTKVYQPCKLLVKLSDPKATGFVTVNGRAYRIKDLNKELALPKVKTAKIKVFAFGYRKYVKRFPVVEGKILPLEVSLHKSRRPVLQVETNPEGATLFVGGDERCDTPCRLSSESVGKKLKLVVFKEGYKTEKMSVLLRRRTIGRRILLTLKPEKIAPVPRQASRGPAARTARSARGARKARPRSARGARRTRSVSRARPRAARPVPRPAVACNSHCPYKSKGCLWANSKPRCRVYVDGRNTGRSTPIFGGRGIPLRPGSHRVTFVTVNGKKHHFRISIRKCQVTRLVRRLR
ncbi:MAG: protein kinase [Deltaproteobacteria bacterium]|nr:protein kinase [Deltaproteobacteria bacterium]